MKKRNLKKLVSMGLGAVLALGALSGCSSGGSKPVDSGLAEGSQAEDSPAEKSAADGERTTIKLTRCTFNLGTVDGDEVKQVEAAINDYIADKIPVEVVLTDIAGGEYPDKCNLSLANNEINLLWTASWEGAISCDNLMKANAVYDVSELLKGSKLYEAMPEWIWNASSYNGKNYFIPCYKEAAEGYSLMFRKDLADKYEWDLSGVKKLEDIVPMLDDCVAEGIQAPLFTQSTPMFYKGFLDKYAWISGGDLFGVDRETNEIVDVVATDEYRDFVKMMCEWAEKGYLNDGDATKSNPTNAINTDYWGISWWTNVPNNAEASARYGQEVETVPLSGNWIDSSTTLGSCYAVSATSTEAEAKACLDFLGLLYSDKTLADLYTFGIEGVDYDRNEDGTVSKKGDLYNHSAWESCSVMSLSLEAGEPENKTELYKTFNDEAKESVSSGFRFDKTPIESQLSAVDNINQMYGFILENGGYASKEVDDTIETFRKELDAAGYQEVLAEVRAQYDAWKEGQE